jgi:hypothetical protein
VFLFLNSSGAVFINFHMHAVPGFTAARRIFARKAGWV